MIPLIPYHNREGVYPVRGRLPSVTETSNGGFVALMTVIIISAILLIVAVAVNQIGFLTRSEILDAEYKDRSTALAEACVDTALEKLATDQSYSGNESAIPVGSDICAIGSIISSASQITITTNAVFPSAAVTSQGAVTRLQIIVSNPDLVVQSWNEIP